MKKSTLRTWLGRLALGAVGLLLAIQLIPYGRDHANPTVESEPTWDSSTTRELAVQACFDCHSNETEWPWYTSVAPVSWLAQHDVEEGRRILNFSEWGRSYRSSHEAAETVLEGEMPPIYYLPTHADARLTDAEKRQLADGLSATLGG